MYDYMAKIYSSHLLHSLDTSPIHVRVYILWSSLSFSHFVLFYLFNYICLAGRVGELTMLLSDLLWDDMVAGPDTQRIPVPYAE